MCFRCLKGNYFSELYRGSSISLTMVDTHQQGSFHLRWGMTCWIPVMGKKCCSLFSVGLYTDLLLSGGQIFTDTQTWALDSFGYGRSQKFVKKKRTMLSHPPLCCFVSPSVHWGRGAGSSGPGWNYFLSSLVSDHRTQVPYFILGSLFFAVPKIG